MFEIQKGIPVNNSGYTGNRVYPWKDMEIGDSFVLVPDGPDFERRRDTGRAAAYKANEAGGRKFITRVCTEDGKRILRVWRVA